MADVKDFMIEGANIVFRNFQGLEGMYNSAGDRNFAVILDPETASMMLEDGWNVKFLKSRDDDEEQGDAYISVAVSYRNRPPHVVMITSSARTNLSEDTIDALDWAEFENVDLIANAYRWEVNGKTGIKAYLKSMYVTIKEDALQLKYAEQPDLVDADEEAYED
jgi:hypothetical protein